MERTTGIATAVATSGGWGVGDGEDLAWDGTNLFLLAQSAIYTVDRMTGDATRVGTATNFGSSGSTITGYGLAWDGTNLFMVARDDDAGLYTIDRTTGVATRIGDLRWAAGCD